MAGGRRIAKKGIKYYYDYEDRLISGNGLEYYYDNIGVAGFKYGGEYYTYKRDIQNNVIAILDSNGTAVVQYKYDAWGNHTIKKNLILGKLNPFRYRSYFYDDETGLYYLKSRYYDPETGRFLNMDSIDYVDPETLNGLNLYAYCNNNPVMNVDPEGTWSWKGFWNIVGAITMVVAVSTVIAITAGTAAVAIAGATAMASTIGTVVAGTAAVSGIIAGTSEIVNQSLNKGTENINFGSVLVSTIGGSYDGAFIAATMFVNPIAKIGLGVARVASSLVTAASYGASEGFDRDKTNSNMLINALTTTVACFLPSNLKSSFQILFKPFMTGLIKGGINMFRLFVRHPELM